MISDPVEFKLVSEGAATFVVAPKASRAPQLTFDDAACSSLSANLMAYGIEALTGKADLAYRFVRWARCRENLLALNAEDWQKFTPAALGCLGGVRSAHALLLEVCARREAELEGLGQKADLSPEELPFLSLSVKVKDWGGRAMQHIESSCKAFMSVLRVGLLQKLPGMELLSNPRVLDEADLQKVILESDTAAVLPPLVELINVSTNLLQFGPWPAQPDELAAMKNAVLHGKTAVGMEFALRKLRDITPQTPPDKAATAASDILKKVKEKRVALPGYLRARLTQHQAHGKKP